MRWNCRSDTDRHRLHKIAAREWQAKFGESLEVLCAQNAGCDDPLRQSLDARDERRVNIFWWNATQAGVVRSVKSIWASRIVNVCCEHVARAYEMHLNAAKYASVSFKCHFRHSTFVVAVVDIILQFISFCCIFLFHISFCVGKRHLTFNDFI